VIKESLDRTLLNEPSKRKKLFWKKMDECAYKNNLANSIASLPSLNNSVNPQDIDRTIHKLTDKIHQAAEAAVPYKMISGKKRPLWSSEINNAMTESRACLRRWKAAGRPEPSHPLSQTIRTAKKLLRKAMRVRTATARKQLYEKLMDATENKDAIFYKLVSRQRTDTAQPSGTLLVNDELITNPDDILCAWADYFEKLGTPLEASHFNQPYRQQVEDDIFVISHFGNHKTLKPDPVTNLEVIKAITKLNIGKATDPTGIAAEHLKYALPIITPALTSIYDSIFQQRHIPETFKLGNMLPIPKKKKDSKIRENHRGITICSIMCKAFDHILISRDKETMEKDQSPLQYGFTDGYSPNMATLMLTEVLSDNLDNKKTVYVAALDAQKAFDVVWTDSLLCKLYLKGVHTNWELHYGALKGIKIRVKIGDKLSHTVCIKQGVGQGRTPSSFNYKAYINPLMLMLDQASIGCKIGPYYCGCIACADDLIYTDNSPYGLQAMITVTHDYASDERYIIHPQKSYVQVVNASKKGVQPVSEKWYLGPQEIPLTDHFTHLGIERYSDCLTSDDFLEDRVKLARRTVYALMGTGLHGINGVSPQSIKKMLNTYVIPRLIFGLEAMILTDKQKEYLDKYFRNLLKQLLSLPKCAGNESTYLLMGMPPIQAILDIRTLLFFGTIARQKDSLLYHVARRQMATKSIKTRSWFVHIIKTSLKYQLPNPHFILQSTPTKARWKSIVKNTVLNHWSTNLRTAACGKSSLSSLDIQTASITRIHPIWATVSANMRDIERARIKTRLATGTYILQSNRARFNQYEVDSTCPLCQLGEEDQHHFVATCSTLQHIRDKYHPAIAELVGPTVWERLSGDTQMLTKALINSAFVRQYEIYDPHIISQFEYYSRLLLYALHVHRVKALDLDWKHKRHKAAP
jgi:hypothetical protein